MNELNVPVEGDEAESLTLALFFTFGVSLESWSQDGILEREVALYNELARSMDHVYLFTYGGEKDRAFQVNLQDNVTVVPKRGIRNNLIYSLFCPFIHRHTLSTVDFVKTNQMLGSWTAVLTSFIFGATLVVRTGYILSTFYEELDKSMLVRSVARLVEYVAYGAADAVLTSSPHGYEYVEDRYAPDGRHVLLPNYIETDIFRPMDVDPVGDACYVGRLAEQKNLFTLLDAFDDIPYSLTIVGEGDIGADLRAHASGREIDVTFEGQVPNYDLPSLLNGHQVFVLPSYFEGMPKSLLEAMACGLPCVGTNVPGTSDVIEDGENGLLCDTDVESIRDATTRLLEEPELICRLGERARSQVLASYSLEAIVEEELSLYRAL